MYVCRTLFTPMQRHKLTIAMIERKMSNPRTVQQLLRGTILDHCGILLGILSFQHSNPPLYSVHPQVCYALCFTKPYLKYTTLVCS